MSSQSPASPMVRDERSKGRDVEVGERGERLAREAREVREKLWGEGDRRRGTTKGGSTQVHVLA